MPTLYLIPGLGADKTVFSKLDVGGRPMQFIEWIEPLPDETMAAYASRLSHQITDENPVVVGVSFGGMLAVEIAKQHKVTEVILISSAKTRLELPFYFRWAGALHLEKYLPSQLFLRLRRPASWLFGVKTPENRRILAQILAQTDPKFLKWAMGAISRWENMTVPLNLRHIHGNRDWVLPLANIRADKIIPRGGHLMLLEQPDEVSDFILSR